MSESTQEGDLFHRVQVLTELYAETEGITLAEAVDRIVALLTSDDPPLRVTGP